MMNNVVGRNIKAMREDNGLTQYELADKLGVTQTTVSNWETRHIPPRISALESICNLFHATREDVVSENGYYARTRGLLDNQEPRYSDSYLMNKSVGKVWCPPDYEKQGNFFVRVTDRSMDNVLPIDSLALVDVSEQPKNGDIAYISIGSSRLIRRIKQTDGALFLEPDSTNDEYRRQIIDQTDPKSPDVKIIGRIIWAQKDLA